MLLQGLRAWMVQRVTAIYLLLYISVATISMLFFPIENWAQWQQLFATPWFNIATQGFILGLILHAWVGVRDAVIDYINHFPSRLLILTVIAVTLILSGLWSVMILIRVM